MDWPGGLTRDSINSEAGPVRICQKTGQCNNLIKLGRLGGSTHDSGETQPRLGVFFSNVGFQTHWYIYSMFPKKNYVFSIWDKKNFLV
jgi:hypothetical protein